MTDQADPRRHQRLSEYLNGLRPTTQVKVMREVELSELRGDTLGASFKTVMRELRRGIKQSGLPVTSVGSPFLVFYMPLEPFVINEVPDEPISATVPRLSLNPIWAWICRDLLPAEAATYIEAARQALDADDQPSALAAAAAFHQKVVGVGPAAADPKNAALSKRLSAYGGPQTAVTDLRCVLDLLQRRDALRDFAKTLPDMLDLADAGCGARVGALLDKAGETMLPQALAMVMARLEDPWQVVRLAARGGKTREATTELVLGRARVMAAALQTAKWTIDQADEVRARTAAMRTASELIRGELRPRSGTIEDRRCKQIAGLVERCERKIELTLSALSGFARAGKPATAAAAPPQAPDRLRRA